MMNSFKSIVCIAIFSYSLLPVWAADYDYEEQGADWPGMGICPGDQRQSPINILIENVVGDENALEVNYPVDGGDFSLEDTGHTLMLTKDGSLGSIVVNGSETYEVAQLHLHAPAEHLIDGIRYPLEMHIVHSGPGGLYVVVGLMFEVTSRPSTFLQDLIDNLPETNETTSISCPLCLIMDNLMLTGDQFVRYEGSLTTPECDEVVTWFVAKYPLPATQEQLDVFTELFLYEGTEGNFRIEQPLNNRVMTGVTIVNSYDDTEGDSAMTNGISKLITAGYILIFMWYMTW